LRHDLVVSEQATPQGPVFVLKDPRVGRFVRLQQPEYFLARQFDGKTELEEIRVRGERELGAALPTATLERFASKLKTLGLLESPAAPEPEPQAQRRLRGNAFYLRLRVFDPDQLLERLAPRFAWLFTPLFGWASGLVILLAIGVTVGSWNEIHQSLPRLYRVETLFVAWLTLWCIVLGHEFSHGLTCKYFGGRVHEIGMLLVYLQPAMYCNVSDAWLFPEKYKRLLVTLAGAYFEILVWAFATLFWRLTEPGSIPNFLGLVVATTLGIKTLFNLNPLIKLDGYYLLSDWLGIPNLRSKAMTHIFSAPRRLFRRLDLPIATPRERRIYWVYGLLAVAYSGWLMGLILLSLGAFLVHRYQAWGAVFFVALVGAVFRQYLKRSWRFVTSSLRPGNGILPWVKRLVKTGIVVGLLGALLYFVHADLKVSGEFRILPVHKAEIRAQEEGIVSEVMRDEGDSVSEGDLIAQLSDHDVRAELAKLVPEIAEKTALLKKLEAGARSEELALARTAVVKGEERLKFAQGLLEMEKSLYENKLSSKKEHDAAAEVAAVRAKELEESKGSLKLLEAGARVEELEAAQAEINRLTAQQKYLEERLNRLRIISPIPGIVVTHRLKERIGTNLKVGDLFAEVNDVRKVSAEILIPEKEIAEVHLGQPIALKARAHLEPTFQGRVTAISPVAAKAETGVPERSFLVVTELDNKDRLLKPEMTGNAKIYCGERRLYELVFRRLISFVRVEFWSWW
jgi:putative peptide zinc metalloprotease protein